MKAGNALSTSVAPIAQGQKGVGHVETRNINNIDQVQTIDRPSDILEAVLRQSAPQSGMTDRSSNVMSFGDPFQSRTADTASLRILVVPEPSHSKYRRSASEGQILLCLRCGKQHPGPLSVALSTPSISVPMACGSATGGQEAVITPEERGWMKDRLMVVVLLLSMGLFLFALLAGTNDEQR